jgi:hypothetical protein
MSYKSQLYPLSSTFETPLHRRVIDSWSALPADFEEMNFLRSWLVYDCELQVGEVLRRNRGNMAFGLGLALAISASFWTGFALLIEQLLK